jgi:uncharacterized protein
MFSMPSLSKILILVAIISAIWFGFRLLGQLDRQRRDVARKEKDRARARGSAPRQVDDMVKCEVCGTFIARGSGDCGQPNCPF